MMKRAQALLALLLLSPYLFAQMKTEVLGQKVRLQHMGGQWSFEAVAPHIIHVKLYPKDYRRSEQLSNAVLPQPAFSGQPIKVLQQENGAAFQMAGHNIRVSTEGIEIGEARILGPYRDTLFNGFRFSTDEEEKWYGGGERALPLNRTGHRFNLYNNPWYGYTNGAENLNYSVPFLSSSKGYGLFFNNVSKGFVDIGKAENDVLEYGAESGLINCYILFGPTQKEILGRFHQLTGHQPLPPRWALGNFMSRFGYVSQQQTEEIAASMTENKIPFDAVIFDLFWFGDSIQHTMGNLDWVNKKAWPDPAGMIGRLKKQGVHSILITEPFVVKTARTYKASLPYQAVNKHGQPYVLTDFYFGAGGLLDLFRPESQEWFWKYYKKQMDIGVEGWWGDLGEPEKHPADLYHNLRSRGQKRLFSADEVHNLYGHQWTQFLHEKYAQHYPQKRLFSLNRSGFAGTQRYNIFPWTGDVSRNWAGFHAQLPILLGMSMSGVPYVHSDAGGFAGGEGDAELYLRWLQMACYTPIFRPHGTALYEKDKNAFSFPSEPSLMEPKVREVARNIVLQRYRLLPYNYTLAYQQAKHGQPLISPMYYHFEADTTAATQAEQFMWGPDLLVAPVLDKGQTKKQLYLPMGHDWYELGGQVPQPGGQRLSVEATLEQIPVWVKAGAFIPMMEAERAIATTNDCRLNSFELHYYYSESPSESWLFDDDGHTRQSLETGAYQLMQFAAQPMPNGQNISIKFTGKGYAGMPAQRQVKLILHGLPAMFTQLLVNGKAQPLQRKGEVVSADFVIDGKSMSLLVK